WRRGARMTASPKLEKIAAFTRSIVGRTPLFGTARRIPPALPAITLMARRLALALLWLEVALPPLTQKVTPRAPPACLHRQAQALRARPLRSVSFSSLACLFFRQKNC